MTFSLKLPFDSETFPIQKKYFDTDGIFHGVGHTYRVMLLANLLGKITGNIREGNLACYAAIFHDMARVNHLESQNHGRDSVHNKMPLFTEFLSQQQLTPKDITEIEFAVIQHSLKKELPANHKNHLMCAILKDADALDRVRLNNTDISYLRFHQSHNLYGFSKMLFKESIGLTLQVMKSEMDPTHQKSIDILHNAIENWLDNHEHYEKLVTKINQSGKKVQFTAKKFNELHERHDIYIRIEKSMTYKT